MDYNYGVGANITEIHMLKMEVVCSAETLVIYLQVHTALLPRRPISRIQKNGDRCTVVGFEVLTAVSMKIAVCPDDGGSKDL
jgi:hypothetical protein